VRWVSATKVGRLTTELASQRALDRCNWQLDEDHGAPRSMLYGVRRVTIRGPLAGVHCAVLMAVALAACYVPAMRAMRLEPNECAAETK